MKLFQNVGLALVTAFATATLMTACGEEEGGGETGCTADADCATGEICHPGAKVCVPTCESAADCEDSAKNCAPVTDAPSAADSGRTEKICQCATTQLCQDGNDGSSVICSTEHKICVTKCSDDTGCATGLTCNTTTGECEDDGGGPTTCSTSAQQPDACSYGQYCNAGTCAAVPAATCSNFDNTTPAVNFTPSTGTGAVIYKFVDEATNDDAFCASPAVAFTTTLSAYAKAGSTFPATYNDLNGFFYVTVNGTQQDGTTSMRPSGYVRSADGKHANLKVTLCGNAADTQVQAGFYFTGGNPFCATVTR